MTNILRQKNRFHRSILLFLLFLLALTGCASPAATERSDVYVGEEDALRTGAPARADVGETTIDPMDLFEPDLPEEKPGAAATAASTAPAEEPPAAELTEEAAPEEEAVVEDDTDYVEVLFLGDSLFAQGREDGTDIASVVGGVIKDAESKVYNLGIGGSAAALKDDEKGMSLDNWTSSCFLGMAYLVAGQINSSDFDQYHPEIRDVFHQMDKDKLDYIVVDYGVNDFLSGSKIGEYDPENTNPDYSYFVNAYGRALDTLREACPQAKILLCTPCYSQFFGGDGAYLGDGNTVFNGYGNLANYVGLVEYCAGQTDGVIYLDMYHGERMNLDAYTAEDYLLDGIHLTERGRRVYGNVIGQVINRDRGVPEAEYTVLDIDNY